MSENTTEPQDLQLDATDEQGVVGGRASIVEPIPARVKNAERDLENIAPRGLY